MKILLTNDDGIEAPGLEALIQELEKEHECLVVAPAKERSASSHSISLGQKLVIEKRGEDRFAVHGMPADCVKFALSELKDFQPELLVSGINPGPNTGVSVYYSGTISAAREGLINRLPAMAVSIRSKTPNDFTFTAFFTRMIVQGYEHSVFPGDIFLNVNVPDLPESEIKGIKVARQAPSRFIEEFVQEHASDDQRIYSLAGEIQVFDPDGTTDEEVVREGFIAITPLKLDLTDYSTIPIVEKWLREREASWLNLKNT
ncbi:MAG: 5'/3'-nucleotidase SurE [Candidatus Omnitrophica bacterium]|nr:5'/3'-nucleotidase SurE [Candidatus Omnitrophota bacterium]